MSSYVRMLWDDIPGLSLSFLSFSFFKKKKKFVWLHTRDQNCYNLKYFNEYDRVG